MKEWRNLDDGGIRGVLEGRLQIPDLFVARDHTAIWFRISQFCNTSPTTVLSKLVTKATKCSISTSSLERQPQRGPGQSRQARARRRYRFHRRRRPLVVKPRGGGRRRRRGRRRARGAHRRRPRQAEVGLVPRERREEAFGSVALFFKLTLIHEGKSNLYFECSRRTWAER